MGMNLEFTSALIDVVVFTGGIILTVLVLIASNRLAFARSYRVLRRVRHGRHDGARLAVIWELFRLLVRSMWWEKRDGRPKNLFLTVRVGIEHELFHPAAQKSRAKVRDKGRGVIPQKNDLFWNDGARRHSATDKNGEEYVIRVATCNEIYAHREEIQEYLDALEPIDSSRDLAFLTEIEVLSGFVAPLLLLTGLLHHFDDDWRQVIDAYGRDIDPTNDPLSHRLRNDSLRRFQTFLFDCWLLWGPSIPICDRQCYYWDGDVSAIQYGYGDENNSIALISDADVIRAHMKHIDTRSPAFRASARGRLKLSAAVIGDKEGGEVSPALMTAWNTEKGRRIVLDLRPQNSLKALSGNLDDARTTYYSAYLWVLFIIFDGERPIHASHTGDPRQAWRSFLPFFEHGNFGEGDTYRFLKRQLALKTAAALNRIVEQHEREWGQNSFPLRFVYACAVDDSGCGAPRAHGDEFDKEVHGGESHLIRLRTLIEEAIKELPSLCGRKIVDFDFYDPEKHPTNHPYSACSLPEQLAKYYPHYAAAAET